MSVPNSVRVEQRLVHHGAVMDMPRTMIRGLTSLTALALLSAFACRAQNTHVIPSALQQSYGSWSSYAWGSKSPMRAMCVYESTLFQGLSGPITIREIAWRPRSAMIGRSLGPVTYSLDLTLSTTTVNASGMVRTFDSNHGPNKTSVFSGDISVGVSSVGWYEFAERRLLAGRLSRTTLLWATCWWTCRCTHATPVGVIAGCDGEQEGRQSMGIFHRSDSRAPLAENLGTRPFRHLAYFAFAIQLREWPCRGDAIITGTACRDAQQGVSSLRYGGCPDLGANLSLTLNGSPSLNGSHLFVVGLSDRFLGPVTLPIDLTLWGAPGCSLYSSQELILGPLAPQNRRSTTRINVPSFPGLVGARSYFQGIVLDPAANTLGLSTTALLTLTFG